MEKSLEQIFWKGKKFLNGKGKKVNPKPIGLSIKVPNFKWNKIPKDHYVLLEIPSKKVNAYSKKIYFEYNSSENGYNALIQFYKI